MVNGVPGNDDLTSASTQASITIRDVNDSPPTFNKKNYFVSLSENTPIGTPLPLDMSVTDPDVVSKTLFGTYFNVVSKLNGNLYRVKMQCFHFDLKMYQVFLTLNQS